MFNPMSASLSSEHCTASVRHPRRGAGELLGPRTVETLKLAILGAASTVVIALVSAVALAVLGGA